MPLTSINKSLFMAWEVNCFVDTILGPILWQTDGQTECSFIYWVIFPSVDKRRLNCASLSADWINIKLRSIGWFLNSVNSWAVMRNSSSALSLLSSPVVSSKLTEPFLICGSSFKEKLTSVSIRRTQALIYFRCCTLVTLGRLQWLSCNTSVINKAEVPPY